MAGYLDQYGQSDARRERVIKWIVLSTVILAIAGVALYFNFRNFREERQVKRFLDLLRTQEYRSAYALWGCTEQNPCPNYSFEKFLEDWGPQSPHANLSSLQVEKTRSCKAGIIQTLKFGQDEEVWLWVQRSDRVIGYSPWPICDPRVPPDSLGR